MAFDIESIGSGGMAGLVGAILGVFGINRRINNIEEKKQDKTLCESIHKGTDDKFTVLIDGQSRLFERIDALNDYLRNGK